MWATGPLMPDALELMAAWEFNFKTFGFVWTKHHANGRNYCGLGQWTRSGAEYCLLGTRGKPHRKSNTVRQVYTSTPKGHSVKPDTFRTRAVQLCGNVKRIEAFARIAADGWDCFGNDPQLRQPKLGF